MTRIKSLSLYKFDYVLKDMSTDEFELKGGIYSITTYDEAGRILSEKKMDKNGNAEEHYEYEYMQNLLITVNGL